MNKMKSIPDGVSVVMPMLVRRDVASEIDFCKTTFNAVELVRRPGSDGAVGPCCADDRRSYDHDRRRVPNPSEPRPTTGWQLAGSDLRLCGRCRYGDGACVSAGAKVLILLKDQFWGDRTGRIMDPAGHVWTISTRIEETSPEERQERWSDIVKG
jgi:PhnB protein